MKKVFLSLITVFMVLSLSVVLVKASEATTVELVDGVQIRTDGNNGLRWQASVSKAAENQTYGFLFAQGDLAEVTVETANVVNEQVDGLNEDGTFAATMVKFPKAAATQDISVVAYVKDGENYTYSNVVVRNLSEVAVEAYKNGVEGDFVKAVYDASETTFNLNGGDFVADYEFNVTRYETGSSTGYYIGLARKENINSATGKFWERVCLKYDETLGLYKVVKTLISGDVASSDLDYDYVIGTHSACLDKVGRSVLCSLVALGEKASNYYVSFEAPSSSTCDIELKFYSNYELILADKGHFGGSEQLPEASKDYYDFVGWCANEDLSDEIVKSQGVNRTLYAKFAPTEYEINYELNGGNCSANLVTKYNVETASFVLPTASEMTIEEGQFGGWYDNETFSGNPVTEIALGSYGNKSLYAKWIMNAPTVVELTAADEAVFAQLTPSIVVNSTFTSGKYVMNELTYEAGQSAFSNVSAALAAAKDNDVIYLFAGTYTETLTIPTAKVSLIGPNYGISYTETRNAEATISGMINVGASGLTMDGLTFAGAGKAIKVTANTSNLVIKNNIITATGASTNGGRQGVVASDYSINGLTFTGNSVSITSTAGKNAFAVYSTLTDANISNNKFNNGATSAPMNELIRAAYLAGTFKFDNNDCLWGTGNYLIYVGTSSNKCTSASISNNVVKGSANGTTTTICLRRLAANVTFDFVGNTFDYFDTGSTIDFRYANASSTINIKNNVFGAKVLFKAFYVGDGTVNWSGNTYNGGLNSDSGITPGDYSA